MIPVAPWLHDRPVRNHNPGDLRPRTHRPDWPGQDEVEHGPGGPFSVFLTNAEGWAALGLWALDARYLGGLKTARAMIAVFAPPLENNTVSYADGIEARIGARELDLSTGGTLEALCKAIAHWEDSRAVWPEVEIISGMRLCAIAWPAYRAVRLGEKPPVTAPAIETPTTEQLNVAELGKIAPDQPA